MTFCLTLSDLFRVLIDCARKLQRDVNTVEQHLLRALTRDIDKPIDSGELRKPSSVH